MKLIDFDDCILGFIESFPLYNAYIHKSYCDCFDKYFHMTFFVGVVIFALQL